MSGLSRSCVLLGLSLCWLVGCQHSKDDTDAPVELTPMTYAQIAEGHNVRVQALQTMWVRCVVEFRWTDREGEKHFEKGDGPLIVRQPSELALAIGKFGNTRFWLGCDAERYWLFDLDKPRKAYVGEQDNFANAARQMLPLPIRPDQLRGLIGIRALPTDVNAQVEIDGEYYRITLPPDPDLGRMRPIYWLDHHLRPARIQLIDATPRVIVDARLYRYTPLEVDSLPESDWPWVPQRVKLTLGEGQASMLLTMYNAIEGHSKIKDAQFDFERLVRALKVDEVENVDVGPAQ